jgi:hypothetical protein
MVYCDYTASGRCLVFVERYLQTLQRVYANTHTEDDLTGRSMSRLLHEAEGAIKRSVNAGPQGRIVACGTGATGATGAIYQLKQILALPRSATEAMLDRHWAPNAHGFHALRVSVIVRRSLRAPLNEVTAAGARDRRVKCGSHRRRHRFAHRAIAGRRGTARAAHRVLLGRVEVAHEPLTPQRGAPEPYGSGTVDRAGLLYRTARHGAKLVRLGGDEVVHTRLEVSLVRSALSSDQNGVGKARRGLFAQPASC